MRRGRASTTAQFIAFNRALGNLSPQVRGFSDETAERFLPPRWAKQVEQARTRLPKSPSPFWLKGIVLFNQLRTAVLDRAILAALPFEQMVILGAGFDGRAWRLSALRNTIVFEVDHPATQARKKEMATKLPPLVKEVRFVPLDFARDDLSHQLRQAGFDAGKKTFWLWEGVTMYLVPSDVQGTLATIREISPSGSRVALTYMARTKLSMVTRLFLLGFGLFTGEPLRSSFTGADLDALARSSGWETLSNTGIENWRLDLAPALSLKQRQVGIQWNERIWVARH
ncbi:MAG TPA: SAM-dependent methyltransferase [Anaeromyxobacteraceae bacterium]|nr:SAM-dependent methyltransferase [Anaeromyxobacteraceae bacterium]